MMNQRNGMIDFAKLVYILPIILVHANHLAPGTYDWRTTPVIMPGGYVAVEFFYQVFLMGDKSAKSEAMRKPGALGTDTIAFLWGKIKATLPWYLVSLNKSMEVQYEQTFCDR